MEEACALGAEAFVNRLPVEVIDATVIEAAGVSVRDFVGRTTRTIEQLEARAMPHGRCWCHHERAIFRGGFVIGVMAIMPMSRATLFPGR